MQVTQNVDGEYKNWNKKLEFPENFKKYLTVFTGGSVFSYFKKGVIVSNSWNKKAQNVYKSRQKKQRKTKTTK